MRNGPDIVLLMYAVSRLGLVAVLLNKAGAVACEGALDRFCRERLGGFKVPRRYRFVGVLPRNAAGKVLKRELRAEFWDEGNRQVAWTASPA